MNRIAKGITIALLSAGIAGIAWAGSPPDVKGMKRQDAAKICRDWAKAEVSKFNRPSSEESKMYVQCMMKSGQSPN